MSKRFGYLLVPALLVLSACGGGAPVSKNLFTQSDPVPAPEWQQAQFKPASEFKDFCAQPRKSNDFADKRGTAMHEKMWLRSWSHDFYLWYDEITDVDPTSYSVGAYFNQLKTSELTASGANKDNFHFTYDTEEYRLLTQSGVSYGYGMQLVREMQGNASAVRVAFVELGSPAELAGIDRGTTLVSVDGINLNTDNLPLDKLFPSKVGESHQFVIRDVGQSNTRTVTISSGQIQSSPVLEVASFERGANKIGYMVFNDHNAISEAELIDGIEQLQQDQVDRLVLDLRYNGGGYLLIAAQLAYMISGNDQDIFYKEQFNDKYPSIHPMSGRVIEPFPFIDESLGFSEPAGRALPTLNLNSVVVITGPATCSASETIINGLNGVGVEVVLIGGKTCGKPYGFFPQDNCSTTYFTIQFSGVNAIGFGEYADGFAPEGSVNAGVKLPGCEVADDLEHGLGSEQELRLATALNYIETGSCGATATAAGLSKTRLDSSLELLGRGPLDSSMILEAY